MKKTRILIADDHAIVRMGLTDLLEAEKDFEVIGEVSNGADAIRTTLATKPDVLIMDLMMPQTDGAEATSIIKGRMPDAKILILTSYALSDEISRAISAGASGAMLKNAPNAELIAAVRTLASGGEHISADIRRLFRDDPPLPQLSPRQKDVLLALTRGYTNEDIAIQLDISVTSVKTHMESLFAKLGVANRVEAVAIALRKQLLKI